MFEKIDKLIGGIIALGSGIIFILFWRRITQALLKSQHTFWETLGIGKKFSLGSEKVAYFFILLIGILFILVGCYLMYQFFMPHLNVEQIDTFLNNHFNKLKEKKYEAAYADFSTAAKEVFPFSKYLQLQKLVEKKLGNLELYKKISYQKKIGLGSHGLTSAILTYRTKYSNEECISTFIVVNEKGELKIYHYNINSPTLASEELKQIFKD
jgi:hypothetical protein